MNSLISANLNVLPIPDIDRDMFIIGRRTIENEITGLRNIDGHSVTGDITSVPCTVVVVPTRIVAARLFVDEVRE